nr:TRAP transporter small permease subunit [uncultured Sphaerochaeta sp.]
MVKKLEKFLDMLGAIMIAVLFATIIIQVAARVIFSIPSTWTVEVGRALFLAVVFLLTPVVLLNNSLMMINSLHDMTKGKGRFVLDLINDLFVDFILVTLALGSYERTVETWAIEIPTVEWMKSGYLYLVMLIGTVLMLGFSLYNTASRIRKGL